MFPAERHVRPSVLYPWAHQGLLPAIALVASVSLLAAFAAVPSRATAPSVRADQPASGSAWTAHAAAAGAVLDDPGTASTAAGVAQDAEFHVLLPLAALGLYRVAPPQTAVPATATLGPTPPPTATRTPTATYTPRPTATPTPKPLNAQEDDPAVKLTGAWRRVTDARAAGGAYTVSGVAGDKLEVSFSGEHFVLYRLVAPDGGSAAVEIDGRDFKDLAFYFNERRYQVPAVFDNLGAGAHTLVLTVNLDKPRGSTGTNVSVDALAAPSPFTLSTNHQEALTRSNEYRSIAGLPRFRLDRAINLSAKAHADYDAAHNMSGHREQPGQAGFTGVAYWDRLPYFGYNFPTGEVMAWATGMTPAMAVDIWIDSVYHRMPFMDHGNTDIGEGDAPGTRQMPGVTINFGGRDHVPPVRRLIVTYPANNQTDVPLDFNPREEGPNPLPGQGVVGYPISLHIAQPAQQGGEYLPWACPVKADSRRSTGKLLSST